MSTMPPYPWHEQAWRDLIARVSSWPHALLFTGIEGTGKLDFARALAVALACESPAANGSACGTCQSCRWFAAGMHPDYREVLPEFMRPPEAASVDEDRKPRTEIVIDDIRALQEFINLTAHRGGKTIIICPAERLNTSAANALLKNLEEPPPGTRFMLVSHRPSYLPATIISRCQQFAMPAPDAEMAQRWLREQGVAEPALGLAHAGNAPLAALALVDDEFWTQRKLLFEGLARQNLDALALAAQVAAFPVARLLGWLQRWSYDMLSVKSAGRVRYNPDFMRPLSALAERLRAADIARYHLALVREQRIVNHPLNARLFVEQLLLSYAAFVRGESASFEALS